MMLLLTSVMGGLGAAVRYVVDRRVNLGRQGRTPSAIPLGSLVVNVVGSFLLGLLAAAWLDDEPGWRVVLGTGFCGGFTTFSTATLESARLAMERRAGAALLLAGAMLFGSLLAAWAGFALGT